MQPRASKWRSHTLLVILFALIAGYSFSGRGTVRSVQAGGRTCGGTTGASLPRNLTATSKHLTTQGIFSLAAPAQSGESKTWAGQTDFLPGTFERTEILTTTQNIVLDRVWTPNAAIGAVGGPVTQDQPSLSALGNTMYGAWRLTRSGNADIRAGNITTTSGGTVVNDVGTGQRGQPSIVAQGTSTLMVVWQDERDGDPDIYAARSLDGGLTWSPDVQVNNERVGASQSYPMVIAGGIAGFCSCWLNSRSGKPEIYFARSQDGVAWGANVRVNIDTGSQAQGAPRIASGNNGELYAVWEDTRNGNSDIFIAQSPDGTNWTPGVRVNDDAGTSTQAAPDLIVTTTGEVIVVWRDERNGVPEIWAAGSVDRAASWKPNRRIATGVLGTTLPSVSVASDGLLFASWQTSSGSGANLQSAHSIDNGANWFLDGPINDTPGSALVGTRAGLAPTGSGLIRAAWDDGRNVSPTGVSIPSVWSAEWPAAGQYAPSGIYTAPVLDTRGQAAWGTLAWAPPTPAPATSLAFEARVGDTLLPGAGWSAWLPVGSSGASLAGVPRGRFFQWRATFTGPGGATPRLTSVTLTWGTPIGALRARSFLPWAAR